jgi:YidC/Oxa1 family membrane protein insertase
MEKRIIVAFALSIAVLYGSTWLFQRGQDSPASAPEQAVSSAPVAETAVVPGAPAGTAATQSPPASAPLPVAQPGEEIRGEQREEIVFDTALYSATITNVGGVLTSFKLKDYGDEEGRGIELINKESAGKVGWPLAMVSGEADINQILGAAVFAVRREGQQVTLEFSTGGLYARRTLEFSSSGFEFSLESILTKDGRTVAHDVVWQGAFGDQSIPKNQTHENVVYESEGEFERVNLSGIEAQELVTTRAGVEDQYFLAMFLSPGAPVATKIDQKEYAVDDGESVPAAYLAVRAPDAGPLRIYTGPKDQRWLQQTDPPLVRVIDYGFFEVITRPLVLALLWIHSYVGNFGWAIIILTVLINLALFPLRLKQQVSMQKMQKIQPQMRTLQDKYKKLKANDPKRAQVQAEMMGLYKEHGVNPMGGCLPLLLQMPFFFAFWNMLSVSIEMRQAPWLLWIRDLSRPDGYYILPVLMALTMFLMQKMTPSTADPAQAKIMMLMPLLFTFFFLGAQSGLVLYWLTSNVVGIGQQVFINKYWAPGGETKAQNRIGKKGPAA